MCRVVIQYAKNLFVPAWVTDLPTFHRWNESEDFPELGRIDYLAGELWIDQSPEPIWSHNQVRAEFTAVLAALAKSLHMGRYFTSGIRISATKADWATLPDATFISNESLLTERAAFVEGRDGGHVGVEGVSDMVLEVISDSSVDKDTKRLRQLYWDAGIPEYWLVDARREPLSFEILRRTVKGYVSTRKQDGWVKSAVFGHSFRLLQSTDELGHPTFTLGLR